MIVSPRVPWPDSWPRWPHLRVYYFVLFGGAIHTVLAIGLVYLATTAPDPAEVGLYILFQGFVISMFGYGLFFLLAPYFRRRSRIETVEPALVIPCRSVRVVVAKIGVPYMVAGGLILLGVGLRLGDGVIVFYAGLPIAVGVALGVLVLPAHRGRYALRLTPEQVQWHSVQRSVAVSWDIVDGIHAEHSPEYEGLGTDPHQGLHIRIDLIRFRIAGSGKPPECDIMILTGRLTAAPALAFWVIEHYFTHPEHRHELGTEAALERIRRGPD